MNTPNTLAITATITVHVPDSDAGAPTAAHTADVVATTRKLLTVALGGKAREVWTRRPDGQPMVALATFAVEAVTAPAPPEATVDGEVLVCPHCRARDTIVEVDGCIRDNTMYVAGDVLGVDLDDSHFETIRFDCSACDREVTPPLPVENYN